MKPVNKDLSHWLNCWEAVMSEQNSENSFFDDREIVDFPQLHRICVSLDRWRAHLTYLSSLRHWKWIEERSSSTPVLSGSWRHNCMQWRSAASKSPDWYSRCASSANPWKERIRFDDSGAPTQHSPRNRGEGGKQDIRCDGWKMADKWKINHKYWSHIYSTKNKMVIFIQG